jgi:hypothetical protein
MRPHDSQHLGAALLSALLSAALPGCGGDDGATDGAPAPDAAGEIDAPGPTPDGPLPAEECDKAAPRRSSPRR